MSERFTAACLQISAGPEVAANLAMIRDVAREARAQGAQLLMLPEMAAMIEASRAAVLAKAEPEERHQALRELRDLARELSVHLLVGSLAVKLTADRVANRSYLIAPRGEVIASYDKIHMFDVSLPDGESYRESATYEPGTRAVIAPTPWGLLGMTVCYDLRFPALYRLLAQRGADFLTVPSAFTRQTGAAHWHVLLRARAIETGCYVFAPAQCGEHAGGRKTYGHSLIVDPWGEILADGGDDVGVVLAEIDPVKVAEARRRIPSLSLERAYDAPVAPGLTISARRSSA